MAVEIDKYDFDPDYLRKKYREERDKRLRQDGNEQYQEVSGEFAYFVEDPYIDDEIDRESVNEDVEVVIIGGGFGGMLAGARLREAGIDDFKIIEKGGILVEHGIGIDILALLVISSPTFTFLY